jgi:hypothetical protein
MLPQNTHIHITVLPALPVEQDPALHQDKASPHPCPQRCFTHIHVDLVGLIQLGSNCNYIFTVIDPTSKWMEVIPLPAIFAVDCACALVFHWITHFGVLATITSDRGLQCTSSLWAALCEMLSILHRQTTAYHPEADALVERLHRHLKDGFHVRAGRCSNLGRRDTRWVLFCLRSQPREDTGLSPAEAVYGVPLVMPSEFLQIEEFSVDQIVNKFSKSICRYSCISCLTNIIRASSC